MLAASDSERAAHDLLQPLNVISLAVANLRVRIGPQLSPADARYFNDKLDRIEQQITRAVALSDPRLAGCARLRGERRGRAG